MTTWPTISGKPPRHHYGIFPWTVLDSSSGAWQKRKKALIKSGIDDLAGRKQGLLMGGDFGREISGGTSRFDPVLADVLYQWYAPHGGQVYDPFAGGVTRGVLAAMHDMHYTGIDLSPQQVETNREQAQALGFVTPQWRVGDSRDYSPPPDSVDMVLTCPPYWNLERYSTNPRDLSAMSWEDHLDALETVAAHCHTALRENRFLVWVTGDLRDKHGALCQLPDHTRRILTHAGFTPINTHILITPVGSLHRYLRRWWTSTRTAGRRHQEVIVMVKGDRRAATQVINQAFINHYENLGKLYAGSRLPSRKDRQNREKNTQGGIQA